MTPAEALAQIRALDTFDVSVWGEPGSPFANGARAMLRQVRAVLDAVSVDATPAQGIDREALLRYLRTEGLKDSIEQVVDRILALVRPVEGTVLSPGSDEAKAIIRAQGLLARPGDDYWLANTLRALAARLEAAS